MALMSGVWSESQRLAGAARIGLGILLLASLIHPDTREIQILTGRMLLRLWHPTANVSVQGRHQDNPGDLDVPNVYFTDEYKNRLIAGAAVSPDAFIKAAPYNSRYTAAPTIQLWDSHPLMEWIAFRLTARSILDSLSQDTATPKFDPLKSLEFVRAAQRADPANGALWLAEASLRGLMDQTDSAVQALEAAAEKKTWRSPNGAATAYIKTLLESDGLPPIDAVRDAGGASVPLNLISNWAIRRGISRALAEAILKDDRGKILSLLALIQKLEEPKWEGRVLENRLKLLSVSPDWIDVLHAIAVKLEIPQKLEWYRYEAKKQIMRQYLARYAGPEKVNDLFQQAQLSEAQRNLESHEFWGSLPQNVISWNQKFGGWSRDLLLFFILASILMNALFVGCWNRVEPGGGLSRDARFGASAMRVMLVVGLIVILGDATRDHFPAFVRDFLSSGDLPEILFPGGIVGYFFAILTISVLLCLKICKDDFTGPGQKFQTAGFWLGAAAAAGMCSLMYGSFIAIDQAIEGPAMIQALSTQALCGLLITLPWLSLKIVYHRTKSKPRMFPASVVILGYLYLLAVAIRALSKYYILESLKNPVEWMM